jgi:hypothetical protein
MATNVDKEKVEKKEKKGKKQVSLDTSPAQVLEWDKEGFDLVFNPERGQFLVLDAAAVKALSDMNRTRYLVTKEIFEDQPEEDDLNALMSKIDFSTQGMKASDKLKNIDTELYQYGFRSEADLPKAVKDGWTVVSGEKNHLNRSGQGLTHLRDAKGKTAQVLVKIRRDKHQANMRKAHEKIDAFISGVDDSTREKFNRVAGSDKSVGGDIALSEAAEGE